MIAVPNQRAGNQIRQERHSAARWAINISSFAFRVSLLSRHVMLIKWWFWLRNQSFSQLQTGDSQERLVLISDSPRKTGKEKRREKTTFSYMGVQFHCSCIKQHNCFRFAEIAMQSKLTRDCFQWKYFESLPIMETDPKLGNADISTCTTLWRKGFWVIWAMPERKLFFMWCVSIVTQYTVQSIPRLVFSFLQIGKIYEHQYLGPPKWKHVVSLPNRGRPSSISWDLIFIQNLSLKSCQSQEYRYAPNLISFEIIFPNCINVQYHYWHEKQIYK